MELYTPAVADGKVYFGSNNPDNKVYCLNAANGGFIWSYTTGSAVSSSPAVAYGDVFIGGWDYSVYCFGGINHPPTPPVITGQTNGKAGTSYSYNFVSTDSDNDQVEYYIKWGDGDTTSWTSLQSQGSPGYDESHTWSSQGGYLIEAKARDEHGLESDWSNLNLSMPKNKAYINTPFLDFLQQHLHLFPLLQHLLQKLGL